MRRLRALWKFRRSAVIANLVGRSWVRRANEIRYGRAIEVLQALGRGFTARHLRKKKQKGIEVVQKMGRGYLARLYREKLRAARAAELKAKAKAERERKIRERKEAMERQEASAKAQQQEADKMRRQKMKDAAARVATGSKPIHLSDGSADPDARQLAFKRKPLEGDTATPSVTESAMSTADGDGDLSEESDLQAEESDEEQAGGGMQDPRALLAATAALDVRASRSSSSGGQNAIPGLNLGRLSHGDDYDDAGDLERSGSLSARSSSLSQRGKPGWISRKSALGSMTPRSSRASGIFSSRGRALQDGRKLLVSKTAKGSLIAAALLRVSKRAGESGHHERFALLVGDVLLIFMLAAQPEMPLPLRLWPAQLVCLNQSTLVGAGGKQPEVSDSAMTVVARQANLGALGLQADEHATMERYALAMSLGVASVRRARQQAKLSLAQQLCHEKKLSLLKTQHMIDLLHKSQEMFFEAGSGQFDDCNAVCMHSGVMRQSLIDVTPFMPVSDFICEYCSCVIIPEEQCAAAGEAAEAKTEEHKAVLKKEQQRKLQLDDETLMLARDVRSLRERRKSLDDEVSAMWKTHGEAMATRQQNEALQQRLEISMQMEAMGREDVEKLRVQIQQRLEASRKAWLQAKQQLASRQERIARREANADANDDPLVDVPPAAGGSRLGRKLSFSRRKKDNSGDDGEPKVARPRQTPSSR